MTPSESFDPRTWVSRSRSPSRPDRTEAVGVGDARTRATWAGFLLSAALLLAGAVAAYAMRDAEPITAEIAPAPG